MKNHKTKKKLSFLLLMFNLEFSVKMAHLGRLTIWSPNLRNSFFREFVSPKKYSFTVSNCRWFCDKTCKNVNYEVSGPVLKKEGYGCVNMCAFNRSSMRQFSLTNCVHKKKKESKEKSAPVELEDDIVDDSLLEDPYFEALSGDSRILEFIGSKSRGSEHVGVLVLQPWVKWGTSKRTDTSGQLLLDEAVALVATLPGVQVVAQVITLDLGGSD